ncbi:hypothetical protein CR513_33935, partial [Mucuna pruriens]
MLKLQSGAKELEVINLGEKEEREIRVGKQMSPDLRQNTPIDMLGLDTPIVEHRLSLIPNTIPVRQQLRRMKPEVALKIKGGGKAMGTRLPSSSRIPSMGGQYSVGPQERQEGPIVHRLQGSQQGKSQGQFSPASYRYIQMVVEDTEKTTFITTWGTFYYKVMLFGLKNAKATYQRAMVTYSTT